MNLQTGSSVGPYKILASIGAGGMGEVYRARDTRLDRQVALKRLPPAFGSDRDRLARFEREAKLLASLNHTNIAHIYGFENVLLPDGTSAHLLVMELVEGEDLAERLKRGRIPIDDGLEIAGQIAEALEEAHGKGIVHRDLKPANVKLTPDGKVKVLDFGLAKAWAGDAPEGSSPSSALSQSPTLAHSGTVAGVILGTAAYMSPEQARGKPVDKRADIWSFGVLLWEMLTGQALFAGETVTDIIAAVVTKEPNLDELPGETPRAVRQLIARCLRRDPRMRLPDIGAARLELQEVRAGTTAEVESLSADAKAAGQKKGGRHTRERWVWVAIVLVLAGFTTFMVLRRSTEDPEPRLAAHFILDTPEDLVFGDFNPPALSPDGRYIAFAGLSSSGTQQLWIRSLDSPDSRALPGTQGGSAPFWSPDSRSIAFSADGELRTVVLASGAVRRLCGLPQRGSASGTWNDAGTIVFSNGEATSTLYVVSTTGGDAKALTSHDATKRETAHDWPQFLPDGRHLLFTIDSNEPKNAGLFVISLEAPGERRRILPDPARFWYTAPGHLLSVHGGILTAQPFDARRLLTAGEPVPIAFSVAGFSGIPNWGWFSASTTGRAAWISGRSDEFRLEWRDRQGKRLGELGEKDRYGQISLSPDNRQVAAEIADAEGRYDLWVIDAARGVATRLTTDPANDRDPVWSPDNQELVYSSDATGDQNLLRKGLQGSEPAAPLPGGIGQTPGERDIAKYWYREGNTLLYLTIGAEHTLWAVSLDAHGPPEPLIKGFAVDQPQVSPEGHWLAYISTASGRFEVYLEPFRRRGTRVRVSTNGGGQPRWRGDGKELFYLSLDGSLMSVDVRDGPKGLNVGMPAVLVPSANLRAVVEGPDYSDYAVSADGQRFLVKVSSAHDERQRIHVLLDWPSLIK